MSWFYTLKVYDLQREVTEIHTISLIYSTWKGTFKVGCIMRVRSRQEKIWRKKKEIWAIIFGACNPNTYWTNHTTKKHFPAHTRCFWSSVRTSLRTLAQGISSGHQTGLQLSLPQPGFPLPVEYFSISGIKARSWAWGQISHKHKISWLVTEHINNFTS